MKPVLLSFLFPGFLHSLAGQGLKIQYDVQADSISYSLNGRLIAVNAALIVHRRKFPDIERPFKVPLVPLLPALGILANIYLLSQIFQHIIPLLLAVGAQFFGMFAFIAWRGWQPAEEAIAGLASHVAVSEGRASRKKSRWGTRAVGGAVLRHYRPRRGRQRHRLPRGA